MRIDVFKGKNVAIWGFGREGRSVLKALQHRLPELKITVLSDQSFSDELSKEIEQSGCECLCGDAVSSSLCEFDVIVKSPGISIYRKDIQKALKKGILFTSATNIWFAENPDAKKICVSGTKGKSTTSSLICHLLLGLGHRAVLAGNIGVSLLDLLGQKPEPEYWVIELSSYQTAQLEGHPNVGVLLNLFPEHLDWHETLENYYWDKSRILRQVEKNGVGIFNAANQASDSLKKDWNNPLSFNAEDGFHLKEGKIWDGALALCSIEDVPLRGVHNLENVCAALAAVKALGFKPSSCMKALSSFRPLAHRLMPLGELEGVSYVDDSISTTPQSTSAALEAYQDQDITLILGGYDRGLPWEQFAKELKHFQQLRYLIALPDTGHQLVDILEQDSEQQPFFYQKVDNLEIAVAVAKQKSVKGGVILLSPASPSYNQFKNFQERGICFADYAGLLES